MSVFPLPFVHTPIYTTLQPRLLFRTIDFSESIVPDITSSTHTIAYILSSGCVYNRLLSWP